MTTAQALNPLHVRHVVLTSRHSPSTCAERMREHVAPSWKFWVLDREFRGHVSEERFAVSRWRGSRRSLPPEARGAFVAGAQGSRIEVSIGWRRGDLIALALAVPAAVVAAVALWVGGELKPSEQWLFVLMPFALVLAIALHRLATRHDDDWLVQQLTTVLEATELPEST